MDAAGRDHWNRVYETKQPTEVSWYRAHLETSLALIEQAAPDRRSAVIDVGGGESTLVDDLLAKGYSDLTVLDISATALDATRARLGAAAPGVHWLTGDVTEIILPGARYDVWHDRAVFHFLTEATQRAAYVRQVARAVRVGGHVIIGTFALEGPTRCSGLEVMRYDAEKLHEQLGSRFELLQHLEEVHRTPAGREQQFVWCLCRVRKAVDEER
jgi:ubiquinone/menaquinone biosynthesis C-methylase UbiE